MDSMDNGFIIKILSYHTSRRGYVCTVVILQNGAVIFRDRVFLDLYSSRRLFARKFIESASVALNKPLPTEEVRQFMLWSERHLLALATQLDASHRLMGKPTTGEVLITDREAWNKLPVGSC